MRLTLLAALCWMRSSEITDALLDLLIGLVHKMNARADRRVERELTEELRRVRRRICQGYLAVGVVAADGTVGGGRVWDSPW